MTHGVAILAHRMNTDSEHEIEELPHITRPHIILVKSNCYGGPLMFPAVALTSSTGLTTIRGIPTPNRHGVNRTTARGRLSSELKVSPLIFLKADSDGSADGEHGEGTGEHP